VQNAVNPPITSDIDPFSPEFRADPFSFYAELRRLGRVVRLERYGIWAVSHYDDVRQVLTDWEVFSNAGGGGLANYFKQAPWRPPSIILEVDPPMHERTRTVLMRVVSPIAVRGMRAAFEEEAERLVDHALELGTFDAIPDLVQPFPMTVFPDAVGIAAEGRENLLTYGSMVFGAFGPVTPWYEELMRGAEPVSEWILAHCKREALAPVGLGASIYQAADKGELTEAEAGLLVRSFLSAGVDTTIDSIGLALRCLAENPEQWRLLREDPSLARAAFEEATRYDSSSQSLFRTTMCETELAGVTLGKHEKVMIFVGSAGRDPERWEAPDAFDIRRRTTGHMGYGTGIHGCVAQMMARLEGEVFFQTLAKKVGSIELAGEPKLRMNPGLRGLASLPLTLHPAA
jgi:4-methoxybenzoate monooxygenase (O-demethylating)